jgi:hypothetical protein
MLIINIENFVCLSAFLGYLFPRRARRSVAWEWFYGEGHTMEKIRSRRGQRLPVYRPYDCSPPFLHQLERENMFLRSIGWLWTARVCQALTQTVHAQPGALSPAPFASPSAMRQGLTRVEYAAKPKLTFSANAQSKNTSPQPFEVLPDDIIIVRGTHVLVTVTLLNSSAST